eukprot:158283_1
MFVLWICVTSSILQHILPSPPLPAFSALAFPPFAVILHSVNQLLSILIEFETIRIDPPLPPPPPCLCPSDPFASITVSFSIMSTPLQTMQIIPPPSPPSKSSFPEQPPP